MVGVAIHTISGAGAGGGGGSVVVSTLFWVGLLIAVVVVAGALLMMYRRRLFREEDRVSADRGLLESLREAVRKGEMTPEEFEAAKRVMAARFRGSHSSRPPDRTENPSTASAKSSMALRKDAPESREPE